MTPELIEKLAVEIVAQSFLGNWLFYFLLASLSVVAYTISAFATSYFSTKAANLANRTDINEIKQSLSEHTQITESIKIDLAHLSNRKHALEQLKREKLEHYLLSVIRGADLLSDEAKHHFFGAQKPSSERHTDIASMIQRLYFPELGPAHAKYLTIVAKFRRWIGDGMQFQLEEIKKGASRPSPPENHLAQYPEILEEINIALLGIEESSKSVAAALNGD